MKTTSFARLSVLLVFLIGLAPGVAAQAYPPTVAVGLFAENLLYPAAGTAGSVFGVHATGLLGWRGPLGATGGYVSLSADGDLACHFYGNPLFSDTENLDLLVSLPLGGNRLEIATGLSASLLGTLDTSPFVQPDWRLLYRLERGRRKVRPYVAYEGRYRHEPLAEEDVLYQGAELGILHRPSIRLGYQVGLKGGWELWPDQILVDAGGDPLGQRREDALILLDGRLEGLAGYFLTWNLGAKGGIRLSNANRWLEGGQFEADSESAWVLHGEGALSWSPHRRLNLQAGVFARSDVYFERNALTESDDLSGVALKVLSTGVTGRLDWTLDDRLYFVASGDGGWRLSNDPNERRWSTALRLGLEYSF